MKSLLARIAGAAFALTLSISAAPAEYFSGKTIKILVNFPAGGPSDIEARVIAQYLGKHIPGNPTVLTVNMGGGGGLIATNYMGEIVPNDSTQVSFFTWNPMTQILADPGLRVPYHKFRMIAGFKQPAVVYIRRDVKPGLKQPSDLLGSEPFIVGALAPNTHTTLRSALAFDLLGLKYRMVTGYPGLKEVELAVMKGEVQAASTSLAGYTSSIEPTMVKEGIVLPVFQYDVENPAGRFARSEALPNLPTFLDLYRRKNGANQMPSGEKWDALRLISSIMDNLYRVVLMPPNASDEAVAEMRRAFISLHSDPEFTADYTRRVGATPIILGGEQAEQVVYQLRDTDPSIAAFLARYVKELTGN
ncbi:MAG: hypothetical protein JWM36_4470 [Hyphomicrobiales bacterium]|nr:hypothetical protein [Hyphomicrobiales bacterium]